jgi:type IV pilus assembly protein PilM
MFGKKKSIIGLDIGSNEIKALELTDSGGLAPAITAFSSAKVESQDALRETIRRLIRDGGFHTKRVVTAVSGRSVIVRYISMLQMSEEDLQNAIRYEADKYIPFEVDEVVLDCQKLENTAPTPGEDKEMKVLLVAVKRSLIEEHVGLLSDIGLTPAIIDIDSFALGNAFELRMLTNPAAGDQSKVIALIDIGANKTNINIVSGTVSFFAREVYLAGNDFTDSIARRLAIDLDEAENLKSFPGERSAEVEECVLPTLDDLGNEIHLSFDYYENQFDHEVDEVYISGGSAKLPGIERSFERVFGRKGHFWDPTEGLDIRSDRVDLNYLKNNCSQLAICVGLASRIRGKI